MSVRSSLHFFWITFFTALYLFQITLYPIFHSLEVCKEATEALCDCSLKRSQVGFQDHCEEEAEHNHQHAKDCPFCAVFTSPCFFLEQNSLLSNTLAPQKQLHFYALLFSQFSAKILRSRSPPAFFFI